MTRTERKFKTDFLAKLRGWLTDGTPRHPALLRTYAETAAKLERELAA